MSSSNVGFYLGTETGPSGITKQHVTDISRNGRAQHAKNISKSFLEGVNNTALTNCRGGCLLSLPQYTHTHTHMSILFFLEQQTSTFSRAHSSHTKTMFTGLPSSQVRPRDQEFTVGCELVSPSLDGEGTVHHLPSPPSCWLE